MQPILQALYKLLPKESEFKWTKEHQTVFEKMKQTITKQLEITIRKQLEKSAVIGIENQLIPA